MKKFILLCAFSMFISCAPASHAGMLPEKFYTQLGYSNEYDYWGAAAGGDNGVTLNDRMFNALGKWGFTGSLNERLLAWVRYVVGSDSGSIADNLAALRERYKLGTVYFVDSSADAGGDGKSFEVIGDHAPFKTIAQVNAATFNPGDVIAFRRGDTWREQLIPDSGSSAGYVTYTAYGSGNKPKLLGSVNRSNTWDWNDEGGNIWSSLNCTSFTTDWASYTIYFWANSTASNAKITWLLGNAIPDGETLYLDTFSLKECSGDPGSALGDEILTNPSFETNTTGWTLYTNTGAGANTTGSGRTTTAGEFDSGSAGYKLVCVNNGAAISDIQFGTNQTINITAGKYYCLTYRAKATAAFKSNKISMGMSSSPYTNYNDFILAYDIGNIVFNSEASVGVKCWNSTDLNTQGEYWYDETNDLVKIYSTSNPATYYDDIELCAMRDILDGTPEYVDISNLDLRYGSAHGVGFATGSNNVKISDCEFYFIGGGDRYGGTGTTRYGNGIEFYGNSNNILVENCYFKDIFDEAITCQGTTGTISDIELSNNIFTDTRVGITVYLSTSGTVSNIKIANNTCLYGDGGWQIDQMTNSGSHLVALSSSASCNCSNITLKNNIFYGNASNLVIISNNAGGLTIDNNIYFSPGGGILINYMGQGYYASGFSTYQSASSQDAHSIATDPKLNADYTLQADSPCINAGTDVGVTTDYAGTLRSNPPSIGAYE